MSSHADGARPSLLLVAPDPARRLGLVATLRDAFRVLPDDPSRTAVRRARDLRPGLVLIVLSPPSVRSSLTLCRALKTDRTPVPVAVFDPLGASDLATLDPAGADGVLRGEPPPGVLEAWALDVHHGRGRIEEHPVPRRGLLRRLFGR